jgi:hypothetical protein
MRLISMVDFVLQASHNIDEHSSVMEYHDLTFSYANFLNQPLTLGMFVPCDEEGNVLLDPIDNQHKIKIKSGNDYIAKKEQYQQAKERVLLEVTDFEGMQCEEVHGDSGHIIFRWENGCKTGYDETATVQDACSGLLTLTESAIKQLGL